MRKIGSERNGIRRLVRLGETDEAKIEKQENSETQHLNIRQNVKKAESSKGQK